ncbi:MAG: adenylate/guanylate cyclase domain-containing protein [Spirochaetales bacterium]|nr:adenylate/guanylate cyclase domain-containing protein [Spirochaetales bacterium]
MKVRKELVQLSRRTLLESVPPELHHKLARELFQGYDLHEATGFPATVPIPPQISAQVIVDDALRRDRFLELIELFVRLEKSGFMGRSYPIPQLRELFHQIGLEGFTWDQHTSMFMEDPRMRRTANWGRVLPGEERRYSLLRIDIARNSRLVRTHKPTEVRRAFADLREMLTRSVEDRGGRIWAWEGDGALAAFLFGHATTSATLAGMALLHDLFLYNRFDNPLEEALRIRSAVHTGPLRFSEDQVEIRRQETCKEAVELEEHCAPPDWLVISAAVAPTLDRVLFERFKPIEAKNAWSVYGYTVKLEGA